MSDVIISVERLSKKYRLGQIGATTMRESVERLAAFAQTGIGQWSQISYYASYRRRLGF